MFDEEATHPIRFPIQCPIPQKSFSATHTPITFNCLLEHFGHSWRLITDFTTSQRVEPRGLAFFAVVYHEGSPDRSHNLRFRRFVLDH